MLLLWEGFSFEKLETLFWNAGASLQSKMEKQFAKSQTGKPSSAEWDELGRQEPHPALQIPGGNLKAVAALPLEQVLLWAMKPHQTPRITN